MTFKKEARLNADGHDLEISRESEN